MSKEPMETTLLRALAAAALLLAAATAHARPHPATKAIDGASCGHRAGCIWHHVQYNKFESASQCRDDAGRYCPWE